MPSSVLLSVLLVLALTAAGMLALDRRQHRGTRSPSIELLPPPTPRRADGERVWTAHQAPAVPVEAGSAPTRARAPADSPDPAEPDVEVDPDEIAWSRQVLSRLQQDRPAAS